MILHLKEDSFVDEKPPEEEHLMTGAEIDLSPAETVNLLNEAGGVLEASGTSGFVTFNVL